MNKQTARNFLFPVLDGIFLMILGGYVLFGMTWVPFHGDESTLIRLSLDFVYIFQDHDIQKVVYRPLDGNWSEEQYQRVLTGAIDPLTIGLAWNIAGWKRGEVNGFWRWYPPGMRDEWTYNAGLGNLPGRRLLEIARWPSSAFTALSIVVVFAVALGLSRSRPSAWLAAFLYATAPSVLVNGRRALQEGAMLLFTALVILCALFVIRELRERAPRWYRLAGAHVLLGLASGFALAGKHTAALVVVPAYLAVLILTASAGVKGSPEEKRIARIRTGFQWLGSGLLGLSVFYILMPVWWCYPLHWLLLLCLAAVCFLFGLPLGGWRGWILRAVPIAALAGISASVPRVWVGTYQPILLIAEEREELTRVHETLGMELPTVSSRIGEMADQLLFAKTQYYESLLWDGLEEEQSQIRIYEESHLDGRGGRTVWGIGVLALAFVGLWTALSRRRGGEAVLLLLWFIVPAVILLIINALAWQRYYLILIAPWSVLAGFAAMPPASPEAPGRVRNFLARAIRKSGTGG